MCTCAYTHATIRMRAPEHMHSTHVCHMCRPNISILAALRRRGPVRRLLAESACKDLSDTKVNKKSDGAATSCTAAKEAGQCLDTEIAGWCPRLCNTYDYTHACTHDYAHVHTHVCTHVDKHTQVMQPLPAELVCMVPGWADPNVLRSWMPGCKSVDPCTSLQAR